MSAALGSRSWILTTLLPADFAQCDTVWLCPSVKNICQSHHFPVANGDYSYRLIRMCVSHKTKTRPRRSTFKTETRPRRSIFQTLKTETRPRRSIFRNSEDQDETRRSTFKTETRPRRRSKKRPEAAVSQFKNTTWWSLSLDNLFLAGQIHYFLPDISTSLMHCMVVHKT